MEKKDYFEDIIFAKATPSGSAAVAVTRISGKNSWQIIKNIFKPIKKNVFYESHKLYYGKIIKKNEIIDNCLISTFAENKSFTGEESFEIHSHGSEIISSIIGKILIDSGARPADPGEFSKRAFLNGKIDLTEAEAIMDIVNSSTAKSALIAEKQLNGLVSTEINKIKIQITDLLSVIEVNIDYPEEDLVYEIKEWSKKASNIKEALLKFLKDFTRGQFLREGINTVILGKTNSGKSTLFNFLLNEDKAIVSDIHGTTRDYLDGVINISGYGVRLYDTAGLRESKDQIEMEGTKRALKLAETADIILYVISGSNGITNDDYENLSNINSKKIICILNKIDLLKKNQLESSIDQINGFLNKTKSQFKIVGMSALNKIGIENFNNCFLNLLINDIDNESDDPVITNVRHAALIENAIKSIDESISKLNSEILDLSSFELRESLNYLGEITGEVTTNDILNNIFSKFCIGK